ncbi:MAG: hypothetical protein M1816_001131 [Peltula sp. TS41687]|nr:MAG: hypothetical protein M1816_001131 [Peltula sp. TS41687]
MVSSTASVFSLEGRGLRLETAADIEPHLQALRDNSSVEEVRLGGNTLGVEACEALARVLETKDTLHVVNLADIFTSRLVTEIPPALSSLLNAVLKLPAVHTVDLSDNAFGLATQAPLVDFLSRHTPLQHLILNNNGLGPRAGAMIGDALASLHAKKEAARKDGKEVPSLETVICGRNRLENGSMEAWARAFAAHKGVKAVKMVQNGIRQEGVSHLLRAGLRHATGLKVLDLQDNTFTVLGSRALAEVLPEWKEVQELGIGDCLLSARGAVVVAEAIGKGGNEKLQTLRLQFNDMDVKGLRGFADAAKLVLPALKRIEVNGNLFNEDDPSITALRELLDDRRHQAGVESDDENANEWGLDSLSDLEDEEDDDEEAEEGDEDEEVEEREEERERDEKAERILKDADEAEAENVPEETDRGIDELARKLDKVL